jgi:SAM-dependent methyltransferase
MTVPARASDRDATPRFSRRVEFYVKYRPRYPRALVEHLAREAGLRAGQVVADVGSGTGFLSEVFLCHGCTVWGVEPDADMRAAAESLLAPYPRFRSVEGSAEATGLPDASVDWVVAGQAFHFFDAERARAEFRRILRPGGHAAICWNERDGSGSAFMRAYDALLRRYVPDYESVSKRNAAQVDYDAFFGPGGWRVDRFGLPHPLDREGLRGWLGSARYAPAPDDPAHARMLAELDALFDAHQQDGQVEFVYTTSMYWGRLA